MEDAEPSLVEVLRDPTQARNLTPGAWSALIGSARAANLLGTLATALDAAAVRPEPRIERHLHGARQLAARQRRSVRWEAHCLHAALSRLQVPVLLLKGAAYVLAAHPFARGRMFGDIDILVPFDALGAVESELMLAGWVSGKLDAYDQRYYRLWMHELPPLVHIRRGAVLDVHHTILPRTARNAPDPARIIARSTPLADLPALHVPAPEDLLIHSIVHLVHEGELGNGLRDLWDIDAMARHFGRTAGFWGRLAAYAGGNDLAGPVSLGLQLAQRLLGTPLPPELVGALAAGAGSRWRRPWLLPAYASALLPRSGARALPAVAQGLIYLRSHALRMPARLLLPHLAHKARLRMGPTRPQEPAP